MNCAWENDKQMCVVAANMGDDDLRGNWAWDKQSCADPIVGGCIMSNECGACLDDMNCAWENDKKMCVVAANMGDDDLRGNWAWDKQSCADPIVGGCIMSRKCGECLDDMNCAWENDKQMCVVAANMGDEALTGNWAFDKMFCADKPDEEDKCSKLMTCGECMDNMECAYENDKKMCKESIKLGADDLQGDWAFMKESCKPEEDACSKLTKCGECMANMDCSFEKTMKKCKTAA